MSFLMTTKEVADMIGMHPNKISDLSKNGYMGFYKFGTHGSPRKFSKKHVQDFLESYETKPTKKPDLKILEEIIDSKLGE